MSLTANIQSVKGRPGPVRALEFACVGQWYGSDNANLVALEGCLKYREVVLSEPVVVGRLTWQDSGNPYLRRDRQVMFSMIAPLSAAAITFLEEQRKGGDVSLRMEFRYQWQEARTQATSVATSPVLWNEAVTVQDIPHSEWLKRLNEMEWQEIELFEIAMLPLKEDEKLVESLRLIRKAGQELRQGDYAGVLIDCRGAFESAAKYAVQNDQLRQGFGALLSRVFPEHEGKPETVNGFISGFSGYLQLARHAQYPAVRFTRAEAEFVYSTTLSFFSLISRRLAKTETVE